MKYVLNDPRVPWTDDKILEDIKRIAALLGSDYVSINAYKTNGGKCSQCAIQGHFGTWRNALSAAGLRTERNVQELKIIKDEYYFRDLLRVAACNDKDTVTYVEYKEAGKYSPEHIIHRFGKWDEALRLAGLKPTGLARHKISNEDLFEEIARMWMLLGRQPTSTDIIKKDISKYSIDTYKRRFGSWRNTLEAFVEYANTEMDSESECSCGFTETAKPEPSESVSDLVQELSEETCNTRRREKTVSRHKTSRNIDLRLRWKVINRDHFRCAVCGASPAKDPAIELQIDHIIPWSKGGETVIENLQTLCSKCNLGKSDLEL